MRSIFLQYKRPYYIKRNDKYNSQYLLDHGGPFFKFKITDNSISNQHQKLVTFAKKGREVYYCAPLINEKNDLQSCFIKGNLLPKSFFLPIKEMKAYRTDGHFVTYDVKHQWYPHSTDSSDIKDGISWEKFLEMDKKYITNKDTYLEIRKDIEYFKALLQNTT